MSVTLVVTDGPHKGREFAFDRHDTFLVGRTNDAHLQFSYDDPYFSRRHFLIEVNPPRIRLVDLKSRNGTFVNSQRVEVAELKDGDNVKAGHTIFKVVVPPPDPEAQSTIDMPVFNGKRADIPPALQPHVIPGYLLEEELGRGAMGVVYRAKRLKDGQTVAIKRLLQADGVSEKQIARFVRESQVMAALRHPHVVEHLESSSDSGLVYLVMEYVNGTDASKLVKERGPLPISTAVRIACQMLNGLGHAHTQGFVHRDVKPANLLVGKHEGKGVVKVADFGLARVYDDCKLSGLTMQGDIGGTPSYMAPEQITHYRDVKPAADQYAAAGALYYLLSGTTPRDMPKDLSSQISLIVSGEVVRIEKRISSIQKSLAEIIHRALDTDPTKRYSSVDAFAKALMPHASG